MRDAAAKTARTIAGVLGVALALACAPSEERAEQAREAVAEAIARGDREAALAAIGDLRGLAGDTAEAKLELGQLLVRAGNAPEAGWLLEDGVRRHPDRSDLALALARVSLLLGNPARAREVAEGIASDGVAHGDSLVLRAQAELHLGDLEHALATLAEAERLYPERPEARLVRIATLLSEARQEEARAAIGEMSSELARDEGDEARALLRRLDLILARIQAEQGEIEAALGALRALLEADAADLSTWQAWVQVMASADRSEEALARVEAALAAQESPAELHLLAAQMHAGLGQDEAAEAAIRRYLEASDSAAAYQPLVSFHSRRGDVASTLAALDEALARFPDEATLRLQRTEALLAAERLSEAREERRRFREATFDGDPQVAYLDARILLAEGDAAGAVRGLTRLAPRLDRASTQFWLGRALEETGDLEGARRRYALAQRRDPTWSAPPAALVALEEQRGDWHAVAGLARALVALAPREMSAWSALVGALERLGEGEDAEEVARGALARFPDRAEPRLLLAQALRAQGATEEALAALAEAERNGAMAQLSAARIRTLGMGGRVEAGLAEARDAVAEYPDAPEVQAALASLLFAAGAAEEGARATDRALALAPDQPEPLRERCVFRAATENWPAALDDCTRYLAARPEDAEIVFIRGVCLEQLGKDEAAIAAYRRAAALDRGDARPHNNLAGLLAKQGDLDAALAAAQEAYRLDEANPYVMDTLGALYLEKGLVERAISVLEDAHGSAPDLPDAKLHLARAYHEAGRNAEARPLLADATEWESAPPAPAEIPGRLVARGHPNIVLILVDTLRADFTTPYGFAGDTSPELQRWAGRGVLFERVRAQSSWTKMSMASLLTSLWPHSHGIREARHGLADEAVTLAEVLKAAGYATYGVQTNGWLHQSFGFHQGFDRYVFPKTGGDPRLGRSSLWPHADRVVEEAERLLEAHDGARPFFLYLHFMDVHEYAAPPHLKTFGTDNRGAYLAAIRWVDDAAGRVREKLEATGDLANTLIVFAADHGETFGEHGVHGHARNVLTPAVSVPLVFRFPFRVEPPVRVATQVRNVDVAPTVLELVGVAVPDAFEGSSLVPLLSGRREEPDRPSYAALGVPLFPDASVQTVVSDGSWTYARNAPAPEDDSESYEGKAESPGAAFLFDRRVDPGENANLVSREVAEAARMAALLDAHVMERDGRVVEKGVRIDPGIAERLRAMGYLR